MILQVHRICQLEKKRAQHVKALLGSPSLLKGSLLNLRRPCGRSPCRCERGHLHAQMILSLKEEGKTKFIYIPKEDQEKALELAENMKRFRGNRKELASIEKRILREIRRLEQRLTVHLHKRPS